MDLLDFGGEDMYFDTPVSPEVDALIAEAAEQYGDPEAEISLLRAYFLQPEHFTVLVAMYRYFYYRHRYAEALTVADRAIALSAAQLGLPADWRLLDTAHLGHAVLESMTLTRFLLLALKGSAYLLMRLGEHGAALERLEKVVAMDAGNRLGAADLLPMARAKVTEQAVEQAGDKVAYLRR